MPDDAELEAWFRLLLAPGIGRDTARRLLATFGSPEGVHDADDLSLTQALGERLAGALRVEPPDLDRHLQDTRRWLGGGAERHLLVLGDTGYPTVLLESPDPPLLLFVRGDLAQLAQPSIAVVGSRRPTPQGHDHATAFARRFAEAGYTVVSGLAQGIDGAAHQAALDAGGRSVAVVGTGVDRVYPRQHLELAHRIASHGALVSEYFLDTPPLRENFPQRNRIIAGLSRGTLVVEAALQSGSLITARLANEAGREVFAIPGSIQSPQSKGCHALLRDGAQLVESADDVLDVLGPVARPGPDPAPPAAVAAPDAAAGDRDPLLQALGHEPLSLDMLQARTGWPTHALLARLLELELDGAVARLPGGLIQRRGLA